MKTAAPLIGRNTIRMERQPVLVACSMQTALGDADATWNGLMEGKSALQPVSIAEITCAYPVGWAADPACSLGSHERLQNLLSKGFARPCSSVLPNCA